MMGSRVELEVEQMDMAPIMETRDSIDFRAEKVQRLVLSDCMRADQEGMQMGNKQKRLDSLTIALAKNIEVFSFQCGFSPCLSRETHSYIEDDVYISRQWWARFYVPWQHYKDQTKPIPSNHKSISVPLTLREAISPASLQTEFVSTKHEISLELRKDLLAHHVQFLESTFWWASHSLAVLLVVLGKQGVFCGGVLGREGERELVGPALSGLEHAIQLIGSIRLLPAECYMRVFAAVGDALCVFLGEVKHILFVLLHFLQGFFSLVDHFIDGDVVEVLLLAEDALLVVLEVVHQLQTLILVDEVLDAFDHTPAEVIGRVLSLHVRLFLASLSLSSVLVADFLHQLSLAVDDLHLLLLEGVQLLRMRVTRQGLKLAHLLHHLLELPLLSLNHIEEVYLQVPFLIRLGSLEVLLSPLDEGLYQERIEVELRVLKAHILKGTPAIFGIEIILFGVVVAQGLRRCLIVILLEGVDELACLGIPDVDSLVEGRSHQDVLLLDELKHLDCFGMCLHLPLEIDAAAIQDVLDEVFTLELDFFLSQIAVLQLLEQLLVIVATEVHLVIYDVQQPVTLVEAAQTHAQRTLLLAIFMLECEQSFEAKREGRNANKGHAAIGGSHYQYFLAGLTDRCKLLSDVLNVSSHALASLNVEEGERTSIGSHHDQLILKAIFERSNFDILLKVNGADDFKRFLCFPTNADLIVKGTTDEYVHLAFQLLCGNQVSDFSGVASQILHLGAVGSVVKCDITFGVSDYHALSEEIEVEGRYFE